jgi:hypothetical protein
MAVAAAAERLELQQLLAAAGAALLIITAKRSLELTLLVVVG